MAHWGPLRQIKIDKIDRRLVVITHYIEPVNTKCDWCPQLQPGTRMSMKMAAVQVLAR